MWPAAAIKLGLVVLSVGSNRLTDSKSALSATMVVIFRNCMSNVAGMDFLADARPGGACDLVDLRRVAAITYRSVLLTCSRSSQLLASKNYCGSDGGAVLQRRWSFGSYNNGPWRTPLSGVPRLAMK